MSALQDALYNQAIRMCNDNRYRYYNASEGESNLGPYTFDCATWNSYTIYCAMGWTDWPSSSHGGIGYFWPHITESGFDTFLTANSWQKHAYADSYVCKGAIIITTENLGHSLMCLGSAGDDIADANNYFGYGDNSIARRSWGTYGTSEYAYIYVPPDVPVPGARSGYNRRRRYR